LPVTIDFGRADFALRAAGFAGFVGLDGFEVRTCGFEVELLVVFRMAMGSPGTALDWHGSIDCAES